jgi:hypothetical protein
MTSITKFPWQPGSLLKATCGLSAIAEGTLMEIEAGGTWDDGEFVRTGTTLVVLGCEVESEPRMYVKTRAVIVHVLLSCGKTLYVPIPLDASDKEVLAWFEVLS